MVKIIEPVNLIYSIDRYFDHLTGMYGD